jgi:hypothetical protein
VVAGGENRLPPFKPTQTLNDGKEGTNLNTVMRYAKMALELDDYRHLDRRTVVILNWSKVLVANIVVLTMIWLLDIPLTR